VIRKLLSAIGLSVAAASATANPPYAPYQDGAANDIYNLLFCDDPVAFKEKAGQEPVDWQRALFSEPASSSSLLAVSSDSTQEGRIRYLAFSKLRALGQPIPTKVLLGVIVEVPLANGLDVLAAFSEGGVRYINQTGKLAFFEGIKELQPLVQRLFAASQTIVTRIGPWDKPRRSPPKAGTIRLTFLVSDGLYFGEGPMATMQRDPMAAPVIQNATELLQTIVPMASK